MPRPRNPSTPRVITPALIREALQCIPPDLDRETWVRLGMAVKAELGADGFELWDAWSSDAKGYSATDARDTWRSIKAGGRVTVGTLFGIAKDYGYCFPDADDKGAATPDPAAQAKYARQVERKRQQQEAEAVAYRERADKAAHVAQALWAKGSDQGESPYLQRKGVQGYGVRYLADGTLLVPMRNAAGDLQNLQRITPVKPSGDQPEKRFLPGGRKSGMLHWLGEPEGAAVLCLAEGYATAASIHVATGRPVAVCFDAGNLVNVAKALRPLFPGVAFLVCGDDDQATAERTGKNPGREKAASAARAARSADAPAGVALPEGLLTELSDFNDLAGVRGLDEVRRQVEAAIVAMHEQPQPQAGSPGKGERTKPARVAPGPGPDDAGDGGGGDGGAGQAGGASGGGVPGRDPFRLDDAGVWFVARDAEGNEKPPQWLCAPLHVTARTRADDANGWGNLLEFTDPDGNPKSWAMPASLLSGEGAEWAGRLRDMGLQMAPGTAARNRVAQYIDTRNPAERVTCTDRVGWHGSVYVLPSSSIGTAEGRRFVFQSESGMEDTFRRCGGLADWRVQVAAPCLGNSRLMFALSCAFAGPMLRPAEIESGGFHFRSGSSQGKTSALLLAASVWGRPSYVQRWRTTDNALEATAVQHSDGLLILDEIQQLDANKAGECAYMLANEQEKGRATRGGLSRKRRTWRLLFLSSGEVSLATHMAEAGKRTMAGQEVRMVDVPLDAGMGMGAIEALNGHEGPGQMVEAITGAASRCYGSAGRAWLEWACEHQASLTARLAELVERYRLDMVPEAASEQVRRVGRRFAVVAAAGELAGEAGITGWPEGKAAWAARQCFHAWLAARGHMDNGEDAAMLRQVQAWLEKNGDALFTWHHRAMDDHRPNTALRSGFKRLVHDDGKPIKFDAATDYAEKRAPLDSQERPQGLVEFMVLPEAFRRDVCKGFDPAAVAGLLRRRGHLIHEADRLTVKQRLPGMGKAACYHIKPSIFDDQL
ncbi:DUF927 domain-containing protein [Paucibacter sp. O1-1]|nr:DUF927 domain-containing protein [Paucibacter sp. O1-1]MDA3826491.1 DUF927 domain-containing protein [Paucibacter sp. O1-1]